MAPTRPPATRRYDGVAMTPRAKRLWGPVLVIAVLCVIVAFVTSALRRRNEAPPETEELAWRALITRGNDLRLWLRFIDIHGHEDESPISDEVIRPRLAQIPRGPVATLASY